MDTPWLTRWRIFMLLSLSAPLALSNTSDVLVMTFNVENLFDTKHDPGKEDWEYLPYTLKQSGEHKTRCAKKGRYKKPCLKKDWSQKSLERKLQQLATVILSVNEGKGPDILILQEVENSSVINQLRLSYLKKADYKPAILIEGDDPRGIDVAMLSRFPAMGTPKLHSIPFKQYDGKSRGILESTFQVGKHKLSVLGVHFPSPRNPFLARKEAFEYLIQLSETLITTTDGVLAAGDFNVKADEDSRLYRGLASPNFEVSHLLGCRTCIGSNYFPPRDSWSFLDAVILHKKSKWSLDGGSIQVIRHASHLNSNGSPKRFDISSGAGVSDHFPILAKVTI